MNIVQLVRCCFGKHHRSKRHAYRDEDGIPRSRCQGCGRRMAKLKEGWRLA